MDPLSHALWGATIIRNRELLALVVGASILPDLGVLPMVFEVLHTITRITGEELEEASTSF